MLERPLRIQLQLIVALLADLADPALVAAENLSRSWNRNSSLNWNYQSSVEV